MKRLPPELETEGWAMCEAEALSALADLPSNSVDAVVTDPPYGIDFAGHRWDTGHSFTGWSRAWSRECLRVLKPGGLMLAFGAPRTVHRLAAGVEAAGFELRDQLLWLYGSGVPKHGLDAQGRSGSLKPAYEPILLARAPLAARSVSANATRFGTGLLQITDARVPAAQGDPERWPANLVLSHDARCDDIACRGECPVRLLDSARPSTRPSRFFYCPKPSVSEREAGCEGLPVQRVRTFGGRPSRRNFHPTVKPVALMRWLVRLSTPPGAVVLDPFSGSGSTGVACLAEGRRFLGIERDPGYARIARARLTHERAQGERRAA